MAVVGLVFATLVADSAAFAAIARMTATHGRTLALAVLSLAIVLSATTVLVLRFSRGGGGDDGGGPAPPEPPWWPDFERAFRDYARRQPPGPRRRAPRLPAGRA